LNIVAAGAIKNKAATLSLLAMDGRILHQQKSAAFNAVETMDLSRYPEGQYLVQIKYDDKIIIKKVKIAAH
jgi:hypothetical protein